MDEKRRAYNRKWVEANREHVRTYREATKDSRNARRRELYAAEPARRAQAVESVRRSRAKRPLRRRALMYGLTEDQLELMLDQGCQICGAKPAVDPTVRLMVDHSHQTGQTRGVLCHWCNLALGHLQDDPLVVAAALAYLLAHETTSGSSGAGSTTNRI